MNDNIPNQPPAPGSLTPAGETLNLDGRTVAAGDGARWIGHAWAMFKQRPLKWIGLGLLYMALELALLFMPALKLLSMLMTPLLLGGLMFACERFRADGEVRLGDQFAGFTRKLGALTLVGLLTFALPIIGLVLLASSVGFDTLAQPVSHQSSDLPELNASSLLGLLVYVAMVCVAVAASRFTPALVILHDMTPISAMRASFRGVLRNWLASIIYGLLLAVMLLVGALPFLLGWLIVIPLSFLSVYVAYRDVFIVR